MQFHGRDWRLKTLVLAETLKSYMADHVQREKMVMKIRGPRRLKESTQILSFHNLLSRPSIEMRITWEPLIKKEKAIKEIRQLL